jgi:hypothetical protein
LGGLARFETIRDDFASLDDCEDRYRCVIELGLRQSGMVGKFPEIEEVLEIVAAIEPVRS